MQPTTLNIQEVENKIILVRNQKIILDYDVAHLYGVATKEINQAVRNNPDKFPTGYVFSLEKDEFDYLRSKFLTANLKKTRVPPKAFTERGLYMLATILRGSVATQTTLSIIETFAQLKELTQAVTELSTTNDEEKQKTLIQKSGKILTDLIDDEALITDSETTIELNLAVLKLKHTVKRKKE